MSHRLKGARARRLGLAFRIVPPRIHCHTRAPSVLASGSKEWEPGTWYLRSGLFYSTKLQVSITWCKSSLHFNSKKVLRWVDHGVKVEFKKTLVFVPKPSTPKFVDPQNVDFVIKDLLKDRHIGTYQELTPGGEQFLSRSRVHTPPGKGKQRIVHTLYNLNETTAKCQTTYEDLRILKSVVRPQDFMLNLDVESVFFHVPIHPKQRKFFSNHLELPLFVNNKFIDLKSGGYFV